MIIRRVGVSLHSYPITVESDLVSLFHVSHVTLSPYQVDLERYTLPLVTEDKNLRIGQEGNNIVLHTAAGVRILYNTATFLLITVPDIYRGRLCGLGGDYDGDPSDDFRLPSGALAGTTQEFITSWKVPEKNRACSDGCDDNTCSRCDVANEEAYSRNGSCGIIRDAEGPFQKCHPRVSPMEYFTHCVHDVCAASGAHTALCHALQAYTAACQAAGATVRPWRTKEFCRKSGRILPLWSSFTQKLPFLLENDPFFQEKKNPSSFGKVVLERISHSWGKFSSFWKMLPQILRKSPCVSRKSSHFAKIPSSFRKYPPLL